MIKIIIEVEEKSTLKFRNVEAKDMCCDIKELHYNSSPAEKETVKELIKRVTKGKKTDILDKTNKNREDRKDVEDIIKLLSRI